MQKNTIDPARVLDLVAEADASFRAEFTDEERAAIPAADADGDLGLAYAGFSSADTAQAESDFEVLAAADALGALAGQIRAAVDRRMASVYQEVLRVYYIAEELSRDPAHPELIPHVEAMRRAHQKQYGRPIPPKP